MGKQLAITILGLGLLASPLASADIVGGDASISYWYPDISGDAVQDNDRLDLEDDLDLGSEGNANLTAALEHPLPLIPNVRLGYTRLEHSGNGEVSGSYGDVTATGSAHSELDVEQYDLTLYYEILDNWVNVDAGLTARLLDAELLIEDRNSQRSESTQVDIVLPMVYLAARFDVPATDFSIGVEGNGIAYSGDSLMDITAYGQYAVSLLRLRAGYRQLGLDVEDGDDTLDLKIGGPFLSAGVDF